jgi:hypothetical protein
MQIGYARSSTIDQEAGYQAQLKALAGCEKVFAEQVSSVGQRQQLDAAMDTRARAMRLSSPSWIGSLGACLTSSALEGG